MNQPDTITHPSDAEITTCEVCEGTLRKVGEYQDRRNFRCTECGHDQKQRVRIGNNTTPLLNLNLKHQTQ